MRLLVRAVSSTLVFGMSWRRITFVSMTAIWEQRDGDWRPLTASSFPDEAALHDRVEEAPQLLPLAGSPRVTVLGRRSGSDRGRLTS